MHEHTRRTALAMLLSTGALLPGLGAARADVSVETRNDLLRLFKDAGSDGTMAVLELARDRLTLVGEARASKGFIPASTFKIPNSLIALEAGVVQDADHPLFKWDGTKRWVADWNRDHTLRTAFKASAVWVYQEIARRVGTERMHYYVRRFGYGNRDIGGAALDEFWLSGDLRISAREQLDFLARFHRDELPVSAGTAAVVREIMLAEEGKGWRIRAKTGLALRTKPGVGWWVGWVERGDDVSLFALNMDIASMAEAGKRQQVAKAILRELGLV